MGKLPFDGSTDEEQLSKRVFDELRAKELKGIGVSQHLHYFIQKMMAREKDVRYQTPADLIADIEESLAGRSSPRAPHVRRARRSRLEGRGPAQRAAQALIDAMRPLLLAIVVLFAQSWAARSSSCPSRRTRGPATQPSDAVALNAEALRLVEAKKFDEALAMIERARKLAPIGRRHRRRTARAILTRRAQARFEGGDLDAAEADLVARARDRAEGECSAASSSRIILRSRGELDRARREVQRALVDDPSCAAGVRGARARSPTKRRT